MRFTKKIVTYYICDNFKSVEYSLERKIMEYFNIFIIDTLLLIL